MRKKHNPLITSQKTRFQAARNLFKHIVLQGLHIANNPQTMSLLRELADMDNLIADRTWQSWFASLPPLPKPMKIRVLDHYLTQLKNRRVSECIHPSYGEMRDGYFQGLVYGGLMSKLLAPTEATDVVHTLMRRAQDYQPASPVHLHFDAMDAAGWHEDCGSVPWSMAAAIAADRILQLLADRWSPRSGAVYAGLSSDMSLKWAAADETQRGEIRRSLEKMTPNPFERQMTCQPSPDWRRLGVSPDIPYEHIYKLLFALAAEPSFLVEDRLQVWSLDFATSALAMHALAWTDRYRTMALGAPPELQYWIAFHEILFNPDLSEIDHWSIVRVMESWPADWSEESAVVLVNARHGYSNLLKDLGLSPSDVCAGLLKTREERPLIYN
jgi:hypothetical protein